MRLLLDTHSFLWFVLDSPRLSASGKRLLEDAENERFLSTVSLWEIAIKISTGKLSFKQPFEGFIVDQIRINEFELLETRIQHFAAVATLPLHHRDPFDRLLIAQAMTESLPIVSVDAAFDAYPIERLW